MPFGSLRFGNRRLADAAGTGFSIAPSTITVTLGGVDITQRVNRYETTIDMAQGTQPSTASVRVRSTSGTTITPIEGQRLTIAMPFTGVVLFDGEITRVDRLQTKATTKPTWILTCQDWLFQFDMDYVVQDYVGQTPNAIITDVLTRTPGFTATDVQSGLTWLDSVASLQQSYNYQRPSQVLQAVAQRVGGAFRVQYNKSVYLRVADTLPSPAALTDANTHFRNLKYSRSIDQFRSIVDAVGSASIAVPIAVPPNATVLPVANAYPFKLPAGLASSQAQIQTTLGNGLKSTIRATYTGTLRDSTVSKPSDARIASCGVSSLANGLGSLSIGHMYRWAFTYVTANGETELSAPVSAYLWSPNTAAVLDLTGLYDTINGGGTYLPPDRSITAINIYRTGADGTQFLKTAAITSAIDNLKWPIQYTDTTADASLSGTPPGAGSICPEGPTSTTITSLNASPAYFVVVDGTKFDQAGGYCYIRGVLYQYISVSNYTLSGGNQIAARLNFTTLPTAGIGDTITATPAVTGVTASTAVTAISPAARPHSATGLGPRQGVKYQWASTFMSASGESVPSALSPQFTDTIGSSPTPTASNKGSGAGPTNGGVYSWMCILIDTLDIARPVSAGSNTLTSDGTTAHIALSPGYSTSQTTLILFRTKAGGSTYYVCPSLTLGGGTFVEDSNTDASLITPFIGNYDGASFDLQEIPIGPTGTTARKIYRNTGPGSALQLLTTISDNTTTSYTDGTADGSLGASPPSTDASLLFGLPALAANSTIAIAATVQDIAAQAVLAALDGSSGQHRMYVSSNAPDVLSLLQQATAELAAGNAVTETVAYRCEDVLTQPNAQIAIALHPAQGAAVNTTLNIQRAHVSWIAGRRMPQFDVTASSRYEDIYQYLTRTGRKAQKVAA